MLLRLLREPRTGRPGPLARIITVVLVAGMVLAAAPALIVVISWLLGAI